MMGWGGRQVDLWSGGNSPGKDAWNHLGRFYRVWDSELYVVRGHSMSPTFLPGEHLAARRIRGRVEDVVRGDVVVLRDPARGGRRHLKRVIGLPGERVRQQDGVLLVDGRRVKEGYLNGTPSVIGLEDRTWELERGEFFVLGDNRAHSEDSRELGPVGADRIAGVVWFRYWPLSRIERIRPPKFWDA